MLPDDPRHGSYAGAVAHWLEAKERPCSDCAPAEWRYRKQRKMDALRGNPRSVPSVGIIRRIQALQAIGWTGPQIAERSGVSVHSMRSLSYHASTTMHARTARKIVTVYDEMCGTWPEGRYADRARSIAERRGWVPPIMWLNIDDPDEQPDPGYSVTRPNDDSLDSVVVDRILGGDMTLAATATKAERCEVVARWPDSLNELERLTGWRPSRYKNKSAA